MQRKITLEAVLIPLLGIYLFKEFEIHENYLQLTIDSKFQNETQKRNSEMNSVLSRFLASLNYLTNEEFFFAFKEDKTLELELRCRTIQKIFSEFLLNTNSIIQPQNCRLK